MVMLGDSGSGKTSMVLRFAEGYFRDGDRSSTIGAFFITKRIQTTNGITCKIQIWDTAGKAQFRSMAPMYYRSAAAAIICYDVNSRPSYKVMTEWLDELHRSIPAGSIVIAIAATKFDTIQQHQQQSHTDDQQAGTPQQQNRQHHQQIPLPFPGASSSSSSTNCSMEDNQQSPTHINSSSNGIALHREAENLARTLGHIYVPTSAKENLGINELFQQIAERVLWFRKQGEMGVAHVPIPVTPGAVAASLRHYTSHHQYSPSFTHSRSISSGGAAIQTSPITTTANQYRGLDSSLGTQDSIILLNSTPSNPSLVVDTGESTATAMASVLHPSILSVTNKDGSVTAASNGYPPEFAYQLEISSAEDDLLLNDTEAQAAAFRMAAARSAYNANNINIRPEALCTDGTGIICDLFATSTRQGSSHGGPTSSNNTTPPTNNLRPLADTTTCCIS